MAPRRNKRVKAKQKTLQSDSLNERSWINAVNSGTPASLTAFARSRATPQNLRELERSLSRIEAFSRHRRLRRHPVRPAIIVNGPFRNWCSDLMIMQNKGSNKGNAYILLLQDIFTKRICLQELKHKNKAETAVALDKAIKRLSQGGRHLPATIGTDMGNEYRNDKVKAIFKKYGIQHRMLMYGFKQSVCERTNKVIKDRLNVFMTLNKTKSWLKILPKVEAAYNRTKHSTTQFPPNKISEKNAEIVFRNSYRHLLKQDRKPPRFQVGDFVRISEPQNIFSKKYKPGFSRQIYKIYSIENRFPVYAFRVEDSSGQQQPKVFVAEELSLVNPN